MFSTKKIAVFLVVLTGIFLFSSITNAAAVVNYKQMKAQRAHDAQMQAYQQQMGQLGQQAPGVPPSGQLSNPELPSTRDKLAQTQSIHNFIYPKTNLLDQNTSSASVAQEVNLDQIWQELEVSSEVWVYMMDSNPKEITIQRYIDWYGKQGVKIKRAASFYVTTIDAMAGQNPDLLKNPFKDVLMIAAVLEYDFDNGQDRDALANRVLGESLYQQNRKRLGLE